MESLLKLVQHKALPGNFNEDSIVSKYKFIPENFIDSNKK